MLVALTPAVCFSGAALLLGARKRHPFGLLEWWALTASVLPVTLGSLLSCWVVKVLFLMSSGSQGF